MTEYINWLSFFPAIFLVPLIPPLNKVVEIDPSKLSYGAATSGVLLTFYGVWQGLVGFDITDTGTSLPVLIDGLKVAFGSSVSGLAVSMLINLAFVKDSQEGNNQTEFEEVILELRGLKRELSRFAQTSAEAQTTALLSSIEALINDLEMGINTETKEVMTKFRTSVEFLREWQEKYVDEIKNVTEAMDKNAVVTQATSEQLDRTNDVLAELSPVTEQIAASIGWVRTALPSMRRMNNREPGAKNEE
jgi:hypothetical protein